MEPFKSPAISTGLKIVGVTAIAYVLAFGYQLGFLRHFGVTFEAIEINPITLIISLGAIILVLINLDNIAEPIRSATKRVKADTPMDWYGGRILRVFLVMVVIVMLLVGISASFVIYLIFLITALMNLLEPVAYIRKNRSFSEAVAVYQQKHQKRSRQDGTYLGKYFSFVALVIFLVTVSIFTGKLAALSFQSAYIVSEDETIAKILIQKNSEVLITKDFDKEQGRLASGFEITPIQDILKLDKKMKIQ